MKALLLAGIILQAPVAIGEKARDAMSLTVYHDGFALVSETRKAEIDEGLTDVRVTGFLPGADGETILLQAPGDAGIHIVRQSFLPKSVDTQTLLQQSVGRWVLGARVNPETGKDEVEAAELLSVDGGLVLRTDERVDTNFPGRIALTDLPPGARSESVLEAALKLETEADSLVISYLTSGIAWKAGYAVLAKPDGTMDLRAYGNVRNETPKVLEGVRLSLVAGELRRAPEMPDMRAARLGVMEAEAAPISAPAPAGDYQRFSLATPATLEPHASHRFSLFAAPAANYEKEYVLRSRVQQRPEPGASRELRHPAIRFRVENTKANGLGVPFPRGEIRVMSGSGMDLTFLGEAAMPAVPVGRVAEWTVGEAFDLSVRRRQSQIENVGEKDRFGRPEAVRVGYEIQLSNAGDETKTVLVEEVMPGAWKMLESTHPYETVSASTAGFAIEVPAGGKATLRYQVRID